MPNISKPFTFSAGAVVIASQHNSDFDTLYNLVNGSLDGTNFASNAAIADTQLAQITTASKVSGSAITSLTSVPSGAGILPVANTYEGPTFSVHKNGTNQTGVATGVTTAVTWSTEVWDNNNNFASNTFTPTVAGKYFLHVNIAWTVGVDQTQYQVLIFKNGASAGASTGGIVQASGTGQVYCYAAVIVSANGSTDAFTVSVNQASGADKIIDGTAVNTYFQGYFIGL